jgi:alpha-beta hydrolase superfamily lysophospholipase
MPELKLLPQTTVRFREWPLLAPSAVLILVHGLGAHTGRWDFLAEYFLDKNVACYAIALKGFGETGGLEGQIDSFKLYYRDLQQLSSFLRSKYPGKKLFLVGESLGGLICFLSGVLIPHVADGVICISPAFKSKLRFSPLDYLKMYFALVFSPQKGFPTPFTSAMCTRDVEYQKKMDADSREIRTSSVDLLFQIVWEQVHARWLANRMKLPVLFLLAGQDYLVRPEESKKVFAHIESKDKQLIEYPEMYHALSIDVGRGKVFEDIWKWVNARK